MGKKLSALVLAAGLMASCVPLQLYAEDLVEMDSEVSMDDSVQEEGTQDLLISSEGLFEVVSEKQSKEGKTLEEVLPQDRLSDSVYHYSESKGFRRVSTAEQSRFLF